MKINDKLNWNTIRILRNDQPPPRVFEVFPCRLITGKGEDNTFAGYIPASMQVPAATATKNKIVEALKML